MSLPVLLLLILFAFGAAWVVIANYPRGSSPLTPYATGLTLFWILLCVLDAARGNGWRLLNETMPETTLLAFCVVVPPVVGAFIEWLKK